MHVLDAIGSEIAKTCTAERFEVSQAEVVRTDEDEDEDEGEDEGNLRCSFVCNGKFWLFAYRPLPVG